MKKRLLLRQGATGLTMVVVLIVMVASAWADTIIDVPNANFDTIYKPDTSQSVYATGLSGYAGLNGDTPLTGTIATGCSVTWSDGNISTGGATVEFPGWTGRGAVQASGINGTWCLAQNDAERVHSVASLGTITANTDYTLTANALTYSWSAPIAYNTLYMELLADGSTVRTSSPITVTTSWASYSVTFTAAQLASHVGQSLTVELGGGGGGDQVQIDNFSLTATTVPEPTTMVSLLSFACTVGLFLGLRRRKI